MIDLTRGIADRVRNFAAEAAGRGATDTDHAGRPGAEVEREALVEMIAIHGRVLKRMPLFTFLLMICLGLLIIPDVSATAFAIWALAVIVVDGMRALTAHRAMRQGRAVVLTAIRRQFLVVSMLSGTTVGAGVACFLTRVPGMHQTVLLVVAFVLPAIGIAMQGVSRLYITPYALCVLVPPIASWCALHPEQLVPATLLTGLYLWLLLMLASTGQKVVQKSLRIRWERDRVVAALEQRNAEVRAAMERAEQSAQSRARVLAAASHDLRQPLHALSVYSAIMAANPGPETLREASRNMDQIVRSLGSMLSGLLDLSRLSVGYYVPDTQVFALDQAIAEVCAEYESHAAAKHLVLERALAPVRIRGDRVALTRIVRNLLDNAIKYTDHGRVVVAVRIDDQAVVLSVSDTGRGIPASKQARVFEEFFQLDNPGRDRNKGAGLGLAIVQRLCELIGASMTLDSLPGQGSRFEVTLGGVVAQPQEEDRAADAPLQFRLKGKRIYLVDDEMVITRSMAALFREWQIDVDTAVSPSAAEALYRRSGRPDALIADLRLGGSESGAELAARLQREFGTHPVLIITGETGTTALLRAKEAGYPVLQKPVPPDVLCQAMVRALNGPSPEVRDNVSRSGAPDMDVSGPGQATPDPAGQGQSETGGRPAPTPF